MIGLYLLCIGLLGLSYICSNRNLFAPGVITSAVWLVCLTLFFSLKHNLPPFSSQFRTALSLWLTLMCLSSLVAQSLYVNTKNRKPSQLIRNIYFYVSIATFPLLLYFAYTAIKNGTTGNWAMDLRLATIGHSTSGSNEAYTPFYFQIWSAAYLIELFYASKNNKNRIFILALLCLSAGFFCMAKILFLNFFILTVSLLFLKKIISTKQVLIGFVTLLVLMVCLQSIRHAGKINKDETQDMFVTYALSSMSGFDTLEPESSNNSGENVFRLFYVIGSKSGLIETKPIDPLLPWVTKPVATNTYTGMYPFFKDFGYWGICLFAILIGFFYGFLFKKAQRNDSFYIILYSYFVYVILMQYVADVLFTNLAGNIKMFILLIIPFIISESYISNKRKHDSV